MKNKVIIIKEVAIKVVDFMCEDNLHTCPYAEEINDDFETLCGCDEEQTYQCMMNI